MFLLLRRHLPQPLHPLAGQLRLALSVYAGASIRWRVRSLPWHAVGISGRTITIAVIAVGMLPALIRAARASCTAIRVIRVSALIPALITICVRRAGGLRVVLRMVLRRMRWRMRCLYVLLPERPPRVHASSAIRPLRRSRLRAQQQQGRKKQPHRQREQFPTATHFHFTVMQLSYFGQFFERSSARASA